MNDLGNSKSINNNRSNNNRSNNVRSSIVERNASVKQIQRKEARRFHQKVSLILTCCFLVSLAIMSIVFGNETLRNDDTRLLLDETNDYSTFSCNAVFDTTAAGSDDQCRFAKTCNGGNGVFAPFVFCSATLSVKTWCWILSPILLLWMVLLFRMLGSTAEDFLSPSLEMFSFKLGLPPRFAGVSLLAFGNGAADVSATVNAIISDPLKGYQLSLGALSGAAMFIGCVVAGCVIVVAKGVPCRGALVRDIMALLLTVIVVLVNLLSGKIGPKAISLFISMYLVFIVSVLLADIYHRAIIIPRLQHQADIDEINRQQMAQNQATQAAGDALNAIAEQPPSNGAISIILTAMSNYDRNPNEQDGWGIDSSDLEHDRPVHLHGRHGLLSSPQPTLHQEIGTADGPDTHYSIVEDGYDRICVSQPGNVTSTNWSGAWHDGVEEFKENFVHSWEDFMCDGDLRIWEKILLLLEFPFAAARKLTIPIPCEGYSCRGILAVSILLSPLWLGYYLRAQYNINLLWSGGFPWILVLFVLSTLCGALILRYAPVGDGVMNLTFATPIALFGFIMAATWIDFIADHLVSLLDFLGIICKIPGSIMGLTILAWGNSMGDLSANMTMARKGLANMAMTACFAGPVFNILIGLSFGFSALSANTGVLEHTVTLNPSIMTGFVAILVHTTSLIIIGTFLCKARIPKEYGYVAIGLYLTYLAISFLLQFGIGDEHNMV